MAGAAGPNTAESGLVFAYDTGNTLTSYIGEPTTNLVPNPTNPDIYGWRTHTSVPYDQLPRGDNYNQLPKIGSGYKMDSTCNASTWSGNAYSYTNYFVGPVTSGTWYNASVWCYVSPEFNGFFAQNSEEGGSNGGSANYDLTKKGTWQFLTRAWIAAASVTSANYLYFGQAGVTDFSTLQGYVIFFDPQFEVKSHTTPFVDGTRSVTQGLLDLGGSSSIDLTNVSFNADAQIVFDGTNDRIALTPTNYGITNQFTIEVVCYPTKEVNGMYNFVGSNGNDRGIMAHWPWSSDYGYLDITNTDGGFHRWYKVNAGILNVKAMYHFILNPNGQVVVKQNNQVMVPSGTTPFSGTVSLGVSNTIGAFYTDGSLAWGGSIYMFKIYKRALTDAETTENYEAIRDRFGI